MEAFNQPVNDRMIDGQLHRSVMYNEAITPGRMHDFLGFMTSCPASDLMLFMGHERPGRRRFGDAELQLLAALLPAFRAGHHALATFGGRAAALARTLDRVAEPLMVVGPDGRERHRNDALRRALAGQPERDRVLAAPAPAASPTPRSPPR